MALLKTLDVGDEKRGYVGCYVLDDKKVIDKEPICKNIDITSDLKIENDGQIGYVFDNEGLIVSDSHYDMDFHIHEDGFEWVDKVQPETFETLEHIKIWINSCLITIGYDVDNNTVDEITVESAAKLLSYIKKIVNEEYIVEDDGSE